jgi:multidrug resistance efflux pump
MDVPRPRVTNRTPYLIAASVVLGGALITVVLARVRPSIPTVDRTLITIDSVRYGTMVRPLRAPGVLVPEEIRLIAAVTSGRVERLPLRPGAKVIAGTVIAELVNPDVQLQALSADQTLAAAEASQASLRASLRSQLASQQVAVASARSHAREAERNLHLVQRLDSQKLVSVHEAARARDAAEEGQARLHAEEERLTTAEQALSEQLALQATQVQRLKSIAVFQHDRVRAMTVMAPSEGVLQEQQLELGQYVMAGQNLAKIARSGRLKAILRVPETQATEVAVGMRVTIDLRSATVPGEVTRIDPMAVNGVVSVEVMPTKPLPATARADISVDGTIELERLSNVTYVGRPANGQSGHTLELFRLSTDGRDAERVAVKLGRGSVSEIEILGGLKAGDRIIISEMVAYENATRLRIR